MLMRAVSAPCRCHLGYAGARQEASGVPRSGLGPGHDPRSVVGRDNRALRSSRSRQVTLTQLRRCPSFAAPGPHTAIAIWAVSAVTSGELGEQSNGVGDPRATSRLVPGAEFRGADPRPRADLGQIEVCAGATDQDRARRPTGAGPLSREPPDGTRPAGGSNSLGRRRRFGSSGSIRRTARRAEPAQTDRWKQVNRPGEEKVVWSERRRGTFDLASEAGHGCLDPHTAPEVEWPG